MNRFVGAQSALELWLEDSGPASPGYLERFKALLKGFPKYQEHLAQKVSQLCGASDEGTLDSALSLADARLVRHLDCISEALRRSGDSLDCADERSIIEASSVFWSGFRLATLIIHGEEPFAVQFADTLRDLRLGCEEAMHRRRAA